MAERTAAQILAALKNQMIVYDPSEDASPNQRFRQIIGGPLGSRYLPLEDVAKAAGVSTDTLNQLQPQIDASNFGQYINDRTALYSQNITPGRGAGFFSSLLSGVGGVVGGLTDTIADPVASALNVHPDAVKAAAALAGLYYGGGGSFFDAATNAVVPEAVATDMIAATLGAEGLAVPAAAAAAPAATAFPVATAPLAPMSTYTAAELAALDAGLGGVGANALAPTAAATAAGVNALSPEALAALDAGLGGVTTTATPANALVAGYGGAGDVLNPITGAVTTGADAATGLAAAGAGAGTGAATNAMSGYGGAGDVLNPATGAVITGADAAAAGLSASAFDTLAKFARDYGVPLSSLISGITGSQAAKDAANVQAESAREARALARQIFDEQKALQEPFRTAGISAQNQLLTLLGLPGGTQGAEFGRYARPFGMQDFQADPGYAFRLSEGMKALEASRAARGGLLSGATGKALSRYGQDLASQEYGNAFNRYQTERVNRLQPLGALMGTGQAAASNQGAAAGQYGQTAGALTTDIGAAQAAGGIGSANAITNALGQYARYASGQNLANQIRQSMYGPAIPV